MSGVATPSSRGPLSTSTQALEVFHIPSLDGVRAFAFLMVFVSHAGLKNLVPGGFGVTIFFVLSGYLITTLLRMELAKNGRISLRAFYVRRSLRIFPLLYLTLGAALILAALHQLSGHITATGVLSQVFHWSNFYLIAHGPDSVVAGTVVLWSLAVEEHFYLVFPLGYRWISGRLSRQGQGWLLAAACLACLLWRLVLILWLHKPVVRTELGTDTRFDDLLFGCLMAIVANPALDFPARITAKRLRSGALLALPLLLFTFIYRNESFRATWRYTLQGVALLPLFAYVIRAKGSVISRVLNAKLARQIGVLSYSLYLIHAIVLECVTDHVHASAWVVGALTLFLALVIAKLLQLGVERPMLAFRRSFEKIRI